MTTNIRVIRSHDFIRATEDGQIDLGKSKKLLIEVAEVAATLVNYEIILDTRKAQGELSATDLWQLAAELSNLGTTFYRKTAVLCPLERFDQAKFFELCAHNRGFRVSAFTSYEEAMEWLMSTGT